MPILYSDRLLAVGEGRGRYFLYGGTGLFSVFDSLTGVEGKVGGNLLAGTGFVGVMGHTPKFHYNLQYSPTGSPYSNPDLGKGVYHRGTIGMGGTVGPKWDWGFSTSAAYGDDFMRMLTPMSFIAVRDVAIPENNLGAFEAGSGTTLQLGATLSIGRQLGTRRRLGMTVSDSYYDFSNFTFVAPPEGALRPGGNNLGTVQISLSDAVTPRTTYSFFAQGQRLFTFPQCTTYGGGVGLTVQLNPQTQLDLNAGPQYANGECGKQQYATAQSILTAALPHSSRVYIRYDRRVMNTFVAGARWGDAISAGYSLLGRYATIFSVDLGYIRIQRVFSPDPFQGYFGGVTLRKSISRSASIAFGYRRAYEWFGAERLNRNIGTVALEWAPLPVAIMN